MSGKPLRPELVQEARKEEVSTIREMGVWEVILVARELKKRYNGGLSNGGQEPTWEDFYASATHQCSANLVRPRYN